MQMTRTKRTSQVVVAMAGLLAATATFPAHASERGRRHTANPLSGAELDARTWSAVVLEAENATLSAALGELEAKQLLADRRRRGWMIATLAVGGVTAAALGMLGGTVWRRRHRGGDGQPVMQAPEPSPV